MYDIPQTHKHNKSAVIYVAAFSSVAGFFSVICNLLALYLVNSSNFNFRKFNKQMTIVAAVGDIISSTTLLIMGIPYGILGYPSIYKTGWYCSVFQSLLSFSTIVTWAAVSLVAVDRFLSLFTPRAVGFQAGWIFLIVVAVTFFSLDIASIFVGQFKPDPTDTYCWYDSNNSVVPNILTILTGIVFIICFIIISITYISVAVYCFRKSVETNSKSLIMAYKRCLAVLFLYYLCLAPNFLTFLWTWISPDNLPFFLHVISPIGLAYSMVVNPMLVLCLHARYRTQLASFMPSNKR